MNNEVGGLKFDGGKARMELISPIAMFALARVLTKGAAKYAERNWENGLAWTRAIGAILRHAFAYLLGETNDPETGESHMAHVMCEAMFLLHFETLKHDFDNRPKYALTPKGLAEITRVMTELEVKGGDPDASNR